MSEDNYQYQDNQPQENEMEEEIKFNQDIINRPISNENPSVKSLKIIREIISEEDNKTYSLKFIPLGSNLKVLLSELDNFPAKIYEVHLALEELKCKSDLFSIYSTAKELTDELNKSDNYINFNIKKKPENVMGLTIIFPSEGENNEIEIDLIENIIDNREMFRQLFEKYKSIQQEQEEDIAQFLNRIKNIEDILKSHEEAQAQENKEVQEEQQKDEQHLEAKNEDNVENNEIQKEIKKENKKEIEEKKIPNKESMNKNQKMKKVNKGNVNKGKVDKKKEEKAKINKKKKK